MKNKIILLTILLFITLSAIVIFLFMRSEPIDTGEGKNNGSHIDANTNDAPSSIDNVESQPTNEQEIPQITPPKEFDERGGFIPS